MLIDNEYKFNMFLLTSSTEQAFEETKDLTSSKFALEFALCKSTTFCSSSMWETNNALEAPTFFFKSTMA